MDPWIGEELEIVHLGLSANATTRSSINQYLEWQGEISSSNNRFNFFALFDF